MVELTGLQRRILNTLKREPMTVSEIALEFIGTPTTAYKARIGYGIYELEQLNLVYWDVSIDKWRLR